MIEVLKTEINHQPLSPNEKVAKSRLKGILGSRSAAVLINDLQQFRRG